MSESPAPESLPREIAPPPELEARIVSALREQALLKARRTVPWLQATAAIVVFAGGMLIGRTMPARPATSAAIAGGPRFLFMLTDAPAVVDDRLRAEEYRQWAIDQQSAGRQITGERLADTGVGVVSGGSAPIAAPEVQGFFIVSASSIDDAVAVARSSPHVRAGGTIIVRPIDTP
jgi:hypothetical protein